jgi:hypothetical protein
LKNAKRENDEAEQKLDDELQRRNLFPGKLFLSGRRLGIIESHYISSLKNLLSGKQEQFGEYPLGFYCSLFN